MEMPGKIQSDDSCFFDEENYPNPKKITLKQQSGPEIYSRFQQFMNKKSSEMQCFDMLPIW
jgi:hypothetical protein